LPLRSPTNRGYLARANGTVIAQSASDSETTELTQLKISKGHYRVPIVGEFRRCLSSKASLPSEVGLALVAANPPTEPARHQSAGTRW